MNKHKETFFSCKKTVWSIYFYCPKLWLHAQHKSACSWVKCTFCSCYKPLPFVWLGAKPAWYTWDHVVRKHWLGLKLISAGRTTKRGKFRYFEDCKQDFVTKFQFESPCCSIFSCIRRNSFFFFSFFHPSPELQSMSWLVSWTLTGMICAGNTIMICKMNPLSSNLWLETDMPLLNLW